MQFPKAHAEVTLVFADIVGSTRLYETLGDAAAQRRVVECQTALASLIECHGQVWEIVGDELMAWFPSADAAMCCACVLHEHALTTYHRGTRVALRIGAHTGRVLRKEDRLFGDTVNTAARMTEIAVAGQTMISERTYTHLSEPFRSQGRLIERMTLKGKQDPVSVYEFLWQSGDTTRRCSSPSGRPPSDLRMMALRYAGRRYCVLPQAVDFTIGRSEACQVVVHHVAASRVHLRVEHQRDKFVLKDQSSNGTYVALNSNEPVFLHRESMPVWGAGTISLGEPADSDPSHLISFTCA